MFICKTLPSFLLISPPLCSRLSSLPRSHQPSETSRTSQHSQASSRLAPDRVDSVASPLSSIRRLGSVVIDTSLGISRHRSVFSDSTPNLRHHERRRCLQADPTDGEVHSPRSRGKGQRHLRLRRRIVES